MHGHAWLWEARRWLAALLAGGRQHGHMLQSQESSFQEGSNGRVREGGFMTLEQVLLTLLHDLRTGFPTNVVGIFIEMSGT